MCKIAFPFQAPSAETEKGFSQGLGRIWVKCGGYQLRYLRAAWGQALAAALYMNRGSTSLMREDILCLGVRASGFDLGFRL